MSTLTQTNRTRSLWVRLARLRDKAHDNLIPRRCMVVSIGLVLAGMLIPLMMTIGLLPSILPLGFIGVALVYSGGVFALTRCGEI